MVIDKTFKLPSEGVQNKTNFALINVFCFGKAAETSAVNALLHTFAAMGKSMCPAAALAAKPSLLSKCG